jgi:hypothetical protein
MKTMSPPENNTTQNVHQCVSFAMFVFKNEFKIIFESSSFSQVLTEANHELSGRED